MHIFIWAHVTSTPPHIYIHIYIHTEKNISKSRKKMGESSKQMNSDSIFVHKTISDVLAEVSKIHDFSQKSLKLDFYVNSLEEETRKVDAFKRELPLCMHLLQDGLSRSLKI